MQNENIRKFINERLLFDILCIYNDPAKAKTICVAALNTTIVGKPPNKNPMVVPAATDTATAGDMNIAMKIATWLAKVNEAGSINTLTGENIGIINPIAVSKPDIASFIVFRLFIVSLLVSFTCNLTIVSIQDNNTTDNKKQGLVKRGITT